MMKKLLLIFIAGILALSAYSQNIQLHYDMGKDRDYLTSTVEMFRPDKTGNTFFFIDMDYGSTDVKNSASLAYFEIARCFKLGKTPFSWHAEYNGGFGQWKKEDASGAYSISNAWLTGIDYSWNASDFSKGFSLKALYKNIANTMDSKPNGFQLTAVWYLDFANGKLRFDGFADFWREKTGFGNYIFLAEPQIWYNVTKKFAIGSEVEISSNFAGHDGFMVNPTVAVKYTF
ncbi:MAG: DUF5020 family protein [Prolixibacteraceae bacterium]|jgi:hypothetical protein